MVRIAITGDHHGIGMRPRMVEVLTAHGHDVIDLAAHVTDVVDYPELCAELCRAVQSGRADLGIVLGGSGQGEVIACNKMRGIRAGLAYSEFAVDISRGNNNANVMVVGTKVIDADQAPALLDRWLATPFNGGVHAERIAQITRLEESGGI
jgi:ribose 5-phosphate isomerase B